MGLESSTNFQLLCKKCDTPLNMNSYSVCSDYKEYERVEYFIYKCSVCGEKRSRRIK